MILSYNLTTSGTHIFISSNLKGFYGHSSSQCGVVDPDGNLDKFRNINLCGKKCGFHDGEKTLPP